MTGTALALSPHLDDAAFSCGATLARLAAKGWRVVVATAFTASVPAPSGFALACQLDKGLPAEADYMAIRRAEDAQAARQLQVGPPVWMPFREAPHRGYGSASALFADVREDDRIDADLADAFAELIAAHQPDLLLGPQAIGGHVDHVQVVRALRAAAGARPVLWWADFPYAVRLDRPNRPFGPAMDAMPSVRVEAGEAALARKRAACRAYASQIGFQFGGTQGLDRRLAGNGASEAFRAAGAVPVLP